MKKIICADLHLGQISDSYIEENGEERSVNETLKQLDNVSNYARKNKIKEIIMAGDIFENKNPIAKYYEMFNSWIKKNNDLDFVLVAGNHDQNNSGSSSLAPLKESGFDHVIVYDQDVTNKSTNDVNYIYLPHLTKKQIGLENIKDYEIEVEKEIQKRIKENIVKDKKNIIISHIHAVGAISGSEQRKLKGGINILPKLSKDIDLIFSGHIHTHQKLKVSGIDFYYPGSLVRNDFAECKEEKGFLVFDEESMEVEFVELKTTEYKVVKINLIKKGFINLSDEKVKKSVSGKVVKLVIDISEDKKKKINLDEILEIFSKHCYVARKEVNIIKSERKDFEIKSYNPLEVFKDYVEKNIEEEKEFIRKEGLEILQGVM